MNYSKVAEQMPKSPIRDMMVKIGAYPDGISFAVGEPDFRPAGHVMEAAKAALDDADSTKYAPGSGVTELREIYAEYISKETGVPYGTDEVIVTVGGMASLFLVFMSMLNDGDEVIIGAPYFSNYDQMIAMAHGKAVPVDAYEENGFVMTAESIREKVTDRTKLILLNSPCNPSGAVISEETLKEIALIAKEHDLFVISDEVYRHILYDGETYHSIASLPEMKERTIIIDSCSKTFAMPGFRVGFTVGPKHLIELMTKLTEGVYSAVVTVTQKAAIEAFKSALPYCEEMRKEYQARRDYLYEHLNRIRGISCILPKGAFYIFVNISGTGLRAEEFCEMLLEQEHMAVVPGTHFGVSNGCDYIRLSYATSMETIRDGVERMSRFCEHLYSCRTPA